MRKGLAILILGCLVQIHGATYTVTTNDDDGSAGTLRYVMLNQAISGDIISLQLTNPNTTIILSEPLPTITQSITIGSDINYPTATIDGDSQTYSLFSIAQGNATLQNLILSNGASIGGDGGEGSYGGGGGAGGGGALYIHGGAQVTLSAIQFMDNLAQGGAGGAGTGGAQGGGGGGGGFGIPGAGGTGDATSTGGGGGGGSMGGAGGSLSSGDSGGTLNFTQSGGGGGGSGGSSAQAGGIAYTPPSASSSNAGGSPGSNCGGSGAGAGGIGNDGTSAGGGVGGIGIGSDTYFGGGGGGGGDMASAPGGAGWGMGGGGGAYLAAGGAGGALGGGGGCAAIAASTYGGQGGFGGGGGASPTPNPTPTLFGGGTPSGQTGGGGAALGGAVFVQNLGTLMITDGTAFSTNTVTASGSGSPAALGPDLFIRSGGTVKFTNSSPLSIPTNIDSDQGAGGGLGGGVVIDCSTAAGSVSFLGINTYTSSTQILSGILQISQNENLGALTNSLLIQNGTLYPQTSLTIPVQRAVSLSGNAKIQIDSSNQLTISGLISGSGNLTQMGTTGMGEGTLTLSPGNNYSGGTNVQAGTIEISANSSKNDSALGQATSLLSMQADTQLMASGTFEIQSIRPITLTGNVTLNVATSGPNTPLTCFGLISGSGSLTKIGTEDLILTGANSYSGGTTVSIGRLVGNTTSLQGEITLSGGTTLLFLQAAPGNFTGTLSGTGTLQIGNSAPPPPFPYVNIASHNPDFSGPTNIFPSGTLKVNGSLAQSSLLTVQQGGFLGGTGLVGPVTSSGTIQPGNSIGTLTVNGDLMLTGFSHLNIEITPTESSLLKVLGAATLNGQLTILTLPGEFYGLQTTYTILTNTGLQSGSFAPVVSDPNFIPHVVNQSNAVILTITIQQPFLHFPYDNPNEESVGENINALVLSGNLPASSSLGAAINSLIGASNAEINRALDQMHPAPFSAFAEIQAALGGQLLSMFHKRPVPRCACFRESRIWVEPYGNWLKEKNLSYQVGFNAISKGVAGGIDTEIDEGITIGIGGGWNDTTMQWRRGQGHSAIKGYYGAVYADYAGESLYLGLSGIAGYDTCHSLRHIEFTTINEQASAERHNLEMMGQFAAAVFFGPSACFAFPYLNIDYFYLQEGKLKEHGAPGLNLRVDKHTSTTLRSEVGFAVQVQDINRENTLCVSPLFGLGWAMEMPLDRPKYTSTFEDQPISSRVQGWDYTWQLFTLRFGFSLTYKCLSLWGGYAAEMSPLEHTPFFDQRGDIRLEYNW